MMPVMRKSNGFLMSRVVLFLNGQVPKKLPDLTQFVKIFCTDGAYKYLQKNGIQPDVISGDFDSYSKDLIPNEIEVVETPDQNFTDFEKALQLIKKRNYHEVYIYGSSGMEHDHFLGNLSAAVKFKNELNLLFFDDFSFYFFTDKQTELSGYLGRTISLYPFPVAKGITTEGLQYPLQNETLEITQRIGTRNKVISEKVVINYQKGDLLLFISNQ